MLGRLMPREGKFFDLFNAHAARIVEGSRELAAMIGIFVLALTVSRFVEVVASAPIAICVLSRDTVWQPTQVVDVG